LFEHRFVHIKPALVCLQTFLSLRSTIGPTTPVHLKGVATLKIDWPTPVMDSTRYLQPGYPHQAAEYHLDGVLGHLYWFWVRYLEIQNVYPRAFPSVTRKALSDHNSCSIVIA